VIPLWSHATTASTFIMYANGECHRAGDQAMDLQVPIDAQPAGPSQGVLELP
jgi:hypothetical protein